jgi:hypothetical protein
MMVGLTLFTKPMLNDDAPLDMVFTRMLVMLPLHFMEEVAALKMSVGLHDDLAFLLASHTTY